METISTYEAESLLPRVINMIIQCHGSKNKITASQIVTELLEVHGITANEARIRKVINFLRTTDRIKCLVATSTGYYIAEAKEDVEEYIQSLKSREEAIKETRESIERQYHSAFSNNQQFQMPKLF